VSHRAVALAGLQNDALIEAVLEDWRTAPVNDKLKATFAFLETLTLRPNEVSPEQMQQMRQAGVSDEGIEEAIAVCAAFSIAVRIADAFDYEVPNAEQAQRFGETRLARGYKM
jgi:alkylhydroperoxidase family enzyme